MEISPNGAINAVLAQKEAAQMQEVQVSMFKKALDINTEGALALIGAATQVGETMTSNPAHLGQNIDVRA